MARRGFELTFTAHAAAILTHDFPQAVREIGDCLGEAVIPIEEIIGSGGGEAKGTQRLRRAFAQRGWDKTCFVIGKTINGEERESVSHEVDHVRTLPSGVIALEIEWNNKDPFFDRDLENFKRLHADGAISLGVIITRGSGMQDSLREQVLRYAHENGIDSHDDLRRLDLHPTRRQIELVERRMEAHPDMTFAQAWAAHFVADKFGAATTHWRKLEDRVRRGVGNPCPLLLIGLPANVITFGVDDPPVVAGVPADPVP